MCTIDNIKVDEAVLRGYDSELNSPEAIGRWVQELVDSRIAEMQANRGKGASPKGTSNNDTIMTKKLIIQLFEEKRCVPFGTTNRRSGTSHSLMCAVS